MKYILILHSYNNAELPVCIFLKDAKSQISLPSKMMLNSTNYLLWILIHRSHTLIYSPQKDISKTRQ